MPWLPMYLDLEDLKDLSYWLNEEQEISIIVSIGERQWKAINNISIISNGRYCLYHKHSGPLPFLKKGWTGKELMIPDPFSGWKEMKTGENPESPYFGAGHPAIFWLNIRTGTDEEVGMSSFEWIGNHYSIIGSPAPEAAMKWWNRLRRRVKKISTQIPRSGPIDGNHREIYTFPNALRKIENGVTRANNP